MLLGFCLEMLPGPPLAPAGRPPKASTVTAVAGPGAGLREGQGPAPKSGAPTPGGAGPSHCRAGPRP